jgi:4-aminobutyrate aminotransferase-like enzyme
VTVAEKPASTSYDVAAETERAAAAAAVGPEGAGDVAAGRRVLHRATAVVDVSAPEAPEADAARRAVRERLFTTTIPSQAPVVDVASPTHGPFVATSRGVVFDAYLGVAQKLLDEHHPRFCEMLEDLRRSDALLRREIATDDYVVGDPGGRVKGPADLAALWDAAMRERFGGSWRAFLSSSGTEAVEAALKLACETAYKRFLERFGMDVFRRVQAEMGIAQVPFYERDPGLRDHPVYEDYPFHVVACEGCFHGRTLGSLSLTRSKRAHQLGYPKTGYVRHVPYNAPGDPVRALVDFRDVREVLAIPGELRRIVREQRRVPKDLFAAFVAEPFQGEGGYVPGEASFFRAARAVCDETGALLVSDEVQTVARTGVLLRIERLGVRPDVVCIAKAMVLGITLAPAGLETYLHGGWHSNTWGGGRVLDVNFAWTVLDTLLHHRDPVLGGLSYLENEEVKGRLVSGALDRLAERHPKIVAGHRGEGLLRAVLVRRRDDVIAAAWRRGMKLLGAGLAGETAPIRLVFLADTLAREVDEFERVLDLALRDVEAS